MHLVARTAFGVVVIVLVHLASVVPWCTFDLVTATPPVEEPTKCVAQGFTVGC